MRRKVHHRALSRHLLEGKFTALPHLRKLQPYVSADLQNSLRKLSVLFAVLNIAIGCTVLGGWQFDIPALRGITEGLPDTKTNSAIALILSGLALLFASLKQSKFLIKLPRFVLALIVVLIGILTLIQYLYNINFGIDELFYKEASEAAETVYPNRMGSNTALIFSLIGLSILFLETRIFKKWVYQFFILIAALFILPAIIGYFYGTEFIYGIATNTKISVFTATGFVLLMASIMFARPDRGVMGLITSNSAGGFMARRLTIIAFLIPMILGWVLIHGDIIGLYDVEFRYLLFVSLSIVVFTYLIWINAKSLHTIDANRKRGENNILFLAQVSKVLSTSLDFRTTLHNLAKLTVPSIADWCSIDILDTNKKVKLLTIFHANRRKTALMRRIRREFPVNPEAKGGIGSVIRTGKSEHHPEVTDDFLHKISRNRKHFLLLKRLHFVSVITVPISSHKNVIGAVTLASAESQRVFTKTDLFIAEELASRAGLAIENSRLYKEAQDAVKLRDEFISIASHELKTPITSLKVYAQILHRRLKQMKNDVLETYVDRQEKQIDHLADLVRDLLDISRLQMGKLELRKDYFNLYELVSEIAQSLQSSTSDHTIEVTNESDELVYADRERIGQVIINLITNATKYSPSRERILIRVFQKSDAIGVSVQDFGIGIDKKHRKRIFEKFYQIDHAKGKSSAGLGVGLFVSSDIAARHGGSLTVESEKNKGSTFYLTLPRKHGAPGIRESSSLTKL